MTDPFKGHSAGLNSPASGAIPVDPAGSPPDHDLSDLPSRALWIGSTGDLAVEMLDRPGVAITFKNVAVGWMPLRVTKVLASTTAGDIVAVY